MVKLGVYGLIFVLFAALVVAEDISITATPELGNAPLTVAFSVSAENITSYAWDFEGDGIVDSTEAAPSYIYKVAGTYEASVNTPLGIGTKRIAVTSSMTVSAIANPSNGQTPLTVQFTSAATGAAPLTYAWDFNRDGTVDSSVQNPTYTFTIPGNFEVILTVTDANGNSVIKNVPIIATKFDSHLNLTSYFPNQITPGENQITLIVNNDGTEPVSNVGAKIVGPGIQYLTTTTIPTLNAGDQDSITVKVNVLQAGELTATVKILDKNFPLTFNVTAQIQYNKDELQTKFDTLKANFTQLRATYSQKKADGFPVGDLVESLNNMDQKFQSVQQQLLTNKLGDAKVGLDIIAVGIVDIQKNLDNVKKPEVTLLMWMKDNAIAIAAIIAALGTIGGFLAKTLVHAKKVKEQAAQKLSEMPKTFPWKKKEEPQKERHPEHKAEKRHEEKKEESQENNTPSK